MERKEFLHSSALLLGWSVFPKSSHIEGFEIKNKFITPPYLKKGDTIGITCPSGYIMEVEIQPAIEKLKEWGFNVEIGETVGKIEGSFGGSDQQRMEDFQYMLNSEHIKAILCARGGYGAIRIIDKIDFSNFRKQPKWIIGFSDATVLHCHIASNYQVATLHSKMCNSFPKIWNEATGIQKYSIEQIRNALLGNPLQYNVLSTSYNRQGNAKGVIIGGNLRTIENLTGTISAIKTKDFLLFLEETQEYLYNIDRMFWNLKRAGKLDHLKGLILGGFHIKAQEDPKQELIQSIYELILEKVKDTSFPVCFNFPIGHQIDNFPIKCGLIHELQVTDQFVILKEFTS